MERIYDGINFKHQHPEKFYCLVKDDMTNNEFKYNLGLNKDLDFTVYFLKMGHLLAGILFIYFSQFFYLFLNIIVPLHLLYNIRLYVFK